MPASIQKGIRILAGSTSWVGDKSFIECSTGIVRATAQYPSLTYWEEAFVPKLPWRSPTSEELDDLVTVFDDIGYGDWVQVFRFPESLFAQFEFLREAAQRGADEPELNKSRPTQECQEAVEHAKAYAKTLLYADTKLGGGDIYFNPTGLPTTSHYRDPLLLGIHTDTIVNVPPRLRRFSPNRLCLNMGSEDRYFLFVNLSLHQIYCMLKEQAIDYREEPRTSPLRAFRTAFMSRSPSYPVIKLRIRPGEGYIAPTENIIHDGCSVGQRTFDMPFHAFGHFLPTVGQSG